MSGFAGKDSVDDDLALHQGGGFDIGSATLKRYKDGTYDPVNEVTYEMVCLWPGSTFSTLGSGGGAYDAGPLCAWRRGESFAPKGQDLWTVAGVDYLIESVATRFDADEATEGYAIYDCQVTRPA